jgi:hypothetical protein
VLAGRQGGYPSSDIFSSIFPYFLVEEPTCRVTLLASRRCVPNLLEAAQLAITEMYRRLIDMPDTNKRD